METTKTTTTAPVTKPVMPSVTTALHAAQAATIALPKTLTMLQTDELGESFFHAAVYAETSMWKTTISARFGDPKETLIILTRRKEQMIPIQALGIQVAKVTDAAALRFAMSYPEKLWAMRKQAKPELGELKNLVLDDGTEGVNLLLDDAEVIDGREVKDRRRSYSEAGKELRELSKIVLAKPINFIIIALAKVRENPITNEEMIGPDLPPSMLNLLLTELEYVFYIKPGSHQLLTDRDFITFKDTDPNTGKEKIVTRTIFSKNKLPLGVPPGVLQKYEQPDLAAIWTKIRAAKTGVGK